MKLLFKAVFFKPLYNLLVWLVVILPGHSVGLAVILLTILVRLVLFPLQHRMNKTQSALRNLTPTINELKEKYKDNQSEQARQLMVLYKEHGINPFVGFLSLLIQLPILIALFLVFQQGFEFQSATLYSFISAPPIVETLWLGINLTATSYVLAIMAGVTQLIQGYFLKPALTPQKNTTTQAGFSQQLQHSLQLQIRYVMPVMIVIIAMRLPAAIPLYWVTSNIFSIIHEAWVRRATPQNHS